MSEANSEKDNKPTENISDSLDEIDGQNTDPEGKNDIKDHVPVDDVTKNSHINIMSVHDKPETPVSPKPKIDEAKPSFIKSLLLLVIGGVITAGGTYVVELIRDNSKSSHEKAEKIFSLNNKISNIFTNRAIYAYNIFQYSFDSTTLPDYKIYRSKYDTVIDEWNLTQNLYSSKLKEIYIKFIPYIEDSFSKINSDIGNLESYIINEVAKKNISERREDSKTVFNMYVNILNEINKFTDKLNDEGLKIEKKY